MEIIIKEVKTKSDLRQFIHLPKKIHKNHKNWVPPIYMDEWDYFNPKKNRSFDHCDHILLLALKEGKVVGRCMGLIHHDYNKLKNEKSGRFSNIETWEDPEVFHALISYVEKWAKERGMEKLIGPFAFSDKDPQGFLFEGFDEPHVIASNCNFPYLVDYIVKEGYTKIVDLFDCKIIIPDELPEIYHKVVERFHRNNSNLKVLEFTSRAKVRPFIRPVLTLFNETFGDIFGAIPFTDKEMDDFANRYLYLINPAYVKIVSNEKDEIIGCAIGMSDIGKGIQKAKGYLLPFGFIPILTAGKKSKQLNLLLGTIDPRYQGRGVDVLMAIKMIESARKAGKKVADSHLELETNLRARAEMERLGGIPYKKFRLFEKVL
ncbi:MAG TPA: hypothetical protein PLK12_09305 [Prolixibacteraceae bacterium]|nr:hypothetical protein [Prolixibacteraceae bacterium]